MSGALSALQERNPEGARTRAPLLAFATDAAAETVLREALEPELPDGCEFRRGDLAEAAKVLKRGASPMVLLVDISGTDNPLVALGELSQLVEPDVRVLAIGDQADVALYRGLTRGLGVLEYLYKPLSADMVSRLIAPLINRPQGGAGSRLLRGGRVIAVTGVHGGVGTSTIAANLAWFLAERARRPTLLLDGDLFGAAASMLMGAKPNPGLRAALGDPDRVDDLFIDRTAQLIGERLSVLSGEGKLTELPALAADALPRLIEMLRRRFKFLVCDAPIPGSPIGRGLFDLAHQRIIVTQPLIAGARDLLRYQSLPPPAPLLAASVSTLVVMNHAGLKSSLTETQFERAVGSAPDLVIPHIPRALHDAANLGEPAAATNRRFGRLIAELAGKAASVGEPARMSRGWWRR